VVPANRVGELAAVTSIVRTITRRCVAAVRRRTQAAIFAATAFAALACRPDAATAPTPAGLDEAALQALVRDVRSGAFGDVRSVLVATGGDAPAEYYFNGAKRSEAVPVYSITKSVTSLVTGSALAAAAIDSVGVKVSTLLPARRALLDADSLRARLTLRDLLTMRAGFDWNELATSYESPTNPVAQMLASSDWIGYVLAKPMARAPGTGYTYNTGATVVLGAAVAAATGSPLPDLAQRELFTPLGIPRPPWHRSADGVTNAGGGLSLRPVDLIAIGRMVRDGGIWNGRVIVPVSWLDESLQPHSVAPLGARYGYQWWLIGPTGVWDPSHPVFMALGWGGQVLLIDRHDDLVAAITARNFDRDPLAASQEWVRRLHAVIDSPKE